MSTNYIKIFSGSFVEVQRIFNALEDENICAIIKDEAESARLAGFGFGIPSFQEILVHRDELERAETLILNLISKYEA